MSYELGASTGSATGATGATRATARVARTCPYMPVHARTHQEDRIALSLVLMILVMWLMSSGSSPINWRWGMVKPDPRPAWRPKL